MGLMDKAREMAGKAKGAAVQHKDQVEKTVDKGAAKLDERTGGKHHEQIDKARGKTKEYVEGMQSDEQSGGESGQQSKTDEQQAAGSSGPQPTGQDPAEGRRS